MTNFDNFWLVFIANSELDICFLTGHVSYVDI